MTGGRFRVPIRLRRPRRAWAGIELGQAAVKFVVLSRRGRRVVLDHFQYLEIPDPSSPRREEALRDALQEIREGCPVREFNVAAVATGLDVAVHLVQLPKETPAGRFRQAAIFQAMGPGSDDSRNLIWSAIRQAADDQGRPQALVASVPRTLVEEMSATLRGAGLAPDLVTVPPLTLFLLAPEDPESGNTAVVDIGFRTTTMTVFRARNLVYSRDTRVGSGLITEELAKRLGGDAALAEMVKRHWILPRRGEVPQPVSMGSQSFLIDPSELDSVKLLAEELVRSLRFVEDRAGFPIQQVVLTGGGSQLQGLAEYLNLSHPVLVAEAAHRTFPPAGSSAVNTSLLEALAPSLTRAVSAAYLGITNPPAARLNLREEQAPAAHPMGLPATPVAAGWIRAAVYGALFVAASHALVRAAEGHFARQREAYAAVEAEGGSGDGVLAPPPSAPVPWADGLSLVAGLLGPEIQLDRVETLDLGGAEAGSVLDPELALVLESPDAPAPPGRGGLRLQGAVRNRRALGDLLVALREAPGIRDSWLEWTRRPEEGGSPFMRFSLVVAFSDQAERNGTGS